MRSRGVESFAMNLASLATGFALLVGCHAEPSPPPTTPTAPTADVAASPSASASASAAAPTASGHGADAGADTLPPIFREFRGVPQQRDGKDIGIGVFGLRPATVLARIGLQNGDVLIRVNGESCADRKKGMAAIGALSDTKTGSVDIERHGAPMSLPYDLTKTK